MTQIPVLSAGLNVSGGTIAGTLATAAQGNVTSLGTLTALTVDDVAVDGKVITMTGSSGDTFVTTVAANGATSLVTTDASAAAAHLTITADGTVDINSAGVLTLDSGAAINIEPAAGSAILLDGTISVDAGVVTGATSVTSTAFVGNLTGTVATATQNSITTATGLVSVGALDSGSITSGFGAIDNGTSNIRSATITAETAFVPDANDGADLGTTSLGFNDLFLADSGSIKFGNDQDVTLTHAADVGLTLVGKLTIDQDDADIGLRIEQAGAERGIFIDQNGNGTALNIDTETTTEEGIIVDASALTTGMGLFVNSNSASSATRQLVRITNDHASATGTTNLYVDNDSSGLVADFHGAGGIRSATGIKFGTDTAAANTLDDYEEGTWTPVLGGSGGTSGQTYGLQAGTYTKVGDMCIASGYITLQAKGTISNTLQLKGLPFTTRNVTNNIGAAAIARVEAWSLADDHTLCCHFGENGTAGTFTSYAGATSSHSTLTTSEVTNTSSIIFSLTYHTT